MDMLITSIQFARLSEELGVELSTRDRDQYCLSTAKTTSHNIQFQGNRGYLKILK